MCKSYGFLKMAIIFARLNKTFNKTHSDMKKLILASLAAGAIATANAQEPRSILLYGDVSLDQMRHTSLMKTTNWNAGPGVGYQFNHNWTVGVNLAWAQSAIKTGGTATAAPDRNTMNMYSGGAFVRYSQYIRRSEIFFWFAQYEFAYTGGYTTHEGDPAVNKYSGVSTRLFPAIGVNVGRGIALNFSVGGVNYETVKLGDFDVTNATAYELLKSNKPALDPGAGATASSATAYSANTLGFTFGRQMNFGISKNFNCGHKMHAHHEPGDEVHRRKIDHMEDEDDAAPKPKRKQRSRDEDE